MIGTVFLGLKPRLEERQPTLHSMTYAPSKAEDSN